MNLVSSNYRVLYQLEREKANKLRENNDHLARRLDVDPLDCSISLAGNKENHPHCANALRRSYKTRKQLEKIEPVISDFSSVVSYQLSQSRWEPPSVLQVLTGRVKQLDFQSPQNEILLRWEFEERTRLCDTQFGLTNILEIKSLVSNIPAMAYRFEELVEEYCYVAQLHRFGKQKTTYYLSVVVIYKHKRQYYYPQIHCFLSQLQPNINYMFLQLKLESEMEPQKLFNRLDILHNLNSLYLFYRESCGMSFLDNLILSVMLDKSVLVRGKSHKHVCQFVYLLTHYSGIPLSHITNYQIVDPELLDLPVPYVFGSTDPSILNVSNQNTILIDLDKCRIQGLEKRRIDFDVKSFVAHLFGLLEIFPSQLDHFEIMRRVQFQIEKSPLRSYMIDFARTMTFHELYQRYNTGSN